MSPTIVSFVSFWLNTAFHGLAKKVLNVFDWVNWFGRDNIDVFLPSGDIIHMSLRRN